MKELKRRGRFDLEQMLSAVDEHEIIATLSSQWESHQSHEVSTARVIAIKTTCSEKVEVRPDFGLQWDL